MPAKDDNALNGQTTDAPYTLLEFLTMATAYNSGYASVAELRRCGALPRQDREKQAAGFANTLEANYTNEVRRRLVDLIRHLRYYEQLEAADFLTGLFARLDGDSALVGREIALQRAAEKKIAEAVERWTDNLLRFGDPVALTNVAELMENDKSRHIDARRVESFAAAFAKAAATADRPEATIKDMFERSQAVVSAAIACGNGAAAKRIEGTRTGLAIRLGLRTIVPTAAPPGPNPAPPKSGAVNFGKKRR